MEGLVLVPDAVEIPPVLDVIRLEVAYQRLISVVTSGSEVVRGNKDILTDTHRHIVQDADTIQLEHGTSETGLF